MNQSGTKVVEYMKANPNVEYTVDQLAVAIGKDNRNSLSGSLSHFYFDAEGEWIHVFRRPTDNGFRSYLYTYDPTRTRLKEQRNVRRRSPYDNKGAKVMMVETGFMLEYLRVLGDRHLFTGEDGTLWVAKKIEI